MQAKNECTQSSAGFRADYQKVLFVRACAGVFLGVFFFFSFFFLIVSNLNTLKTNIFSARWAILVFP